MRKQRHTAGFGAAIWRIKHKLMHVMIGSTGIQRLDCRVWLVDARSGSATVEKPAFHWVNALPGSLKMAGLARRRCRLPPKYAQLSFAGFEYRINRRYSQPDPIPELVHVVLRTSLMPQNSWNMA
ncbi:MAG: hypothetical protein OXD44_06200 [Gammaproteobacteria bacterium]|nr:hypothetical protein [Gammaproteobacteria bacterium]